MATAAYYAWDRDGRPVRPARPVREIVEALEAEYPAAAPVLGWYADETHYQADPAQDHTPFSETGWPVPNPYPYVCATDVMAHSAYDLDKLFAHFLAEARAGRTPWVKYLIYKATIYDVRYGWKPQASSGHWSHFHMSVRSDWVDRSIGSWSPIPGGNDVQLSDPISFLVGKGVDYSSKTTTVGGILSSTHYYVLQSRNAVLAEVGGLRVVIEQLAAALAAGGGSVDMAAIDERLAALRDQVEADTRDAVADLAEGGAAAVRADADSP